MADCSKGSISTRIISPFFAYAITWSLVLILYAFNWSTLLLKLNVNLILFFIVTILVSFICLFFFKKIKFELFLTKKGEKRIHKLFLYSWFLFLFEALVARGFPLFHIIKGDFSYGETEFALPIIHIIFVVLSSIVCSETWLYYKISKTKKFLFYSLLMFIPGILMIARSFILYNALYCFFISLSLNTGSTYKKIKKLLFIFILGIGLLYIFGLAGEVRSTENKTGNNMIIALAKPSDSFRNSNLNEIWLWPYCYITTPLSNLQNTINDKNINPNSELKDVSLVLYHFLPELIKKRLFPNVHKKESLVVKYFNVCSIYADAYGKMGYFGMLYSFLGSFLIILLVYKLKRKKSIYSYFSFIFLSVIILFNMFNNMYNFMGLSPQFWIVLFLLCDWRYVFKLNYKKNFNKDI